MGRLVSILALSLRNGCLVLVEGEEAMMQLYNDRWIYLAIVIGFGVLTYILFKAPFGD